jgi:succinoglycan biosynthesis protein ExoO
MVADNQILFISGRPDIAPWLFITHPDWAGSRDIDLETFLTSSLRGARARDLGYLKPLIRRAAIGELRYDESLTIGEDQDFYARALLNGARFVYTPDAYYCYRRHAQSTSYRLRTDDLDAMIAAEQAFRPKLLSDRVRAISLKRGRQMAIERSTVAAIEAIKRRDVLAAVGHIAEHPSAVLRLSEVIGEAVRKRLAPEKT